MGLEPTKTGFAGQRLDHFGIATPGIPATSWCWLTVIRQVDPPAVRRAGSHQEIR